VFRNQFLILKR